jgi:hypothetical protein
MQAKGSFLYFEKKKEWGQFLSLPKCQYFFSGNQKSLIRLFHPFQEPLACMDHGTLQTRCPL